MSNQINHFLASLGLKQTAIDVGPYAVVTVKGLRTTILPTTRFDLVEERLSEMAFG